jgi:methylenetetrahydrofolate--tRNA-(uracil-5-)-methyltransferase
MTSQDNMNASMKTISVVGAGLAGSECALQLADLGYKVSLYEMRGQQPTPAHKTTDFAELVCSNSFGSLGEISAPGQLKWEAEHLNSYILKTAKECAVPAGQALGIDRELFAKNVTELVSKHPHITIHREVIKSLNQIPRPTVIATGPLTDEDFAKDLQVHFGDEFLYFFDAIAPIIDADTINTEIAWKANRYDKIEGDGSIDGDYFNCPMNKEQYFNFITEIQNAKKIEPKHFETTEFFEGCMPIEAMIERGIQTPRFGPMKPVGLDDPKTGRYPYAVVQLRQDNKEATAFNIVGFQTRMAYGEQTRIFRMIPGLENAEFLKLGSIHRNMYINTPKRLNKDLSSKNDPWLFFAGQITGVEGYFESTCMGMLAAKFLHQKISDQTFNPPPRLTALGSLLTAITDEFKIDHFQPTNINFGLMLPIEEPPPNGQRKWDKKEKKSLQIQKAREAMAEWIKTSQT